MEAGAVAMAGGFLLEKGAAAVEVATVGTGSAVAAFMGGVGLGLQVMGAIATGVGFACKYAF
jgi:hypothetical protein